MHEYGGPLGVPPLAQSPALTYDSRPLELVLHAALITVSVLVSSGCQAALLIENKMLITMSCQ